MESIQKVYEGYLNDDRILWKSGIQELKARFRAEGYTDGKILYELTLARYGFTGALYGDEPRDNEALYKSLNLTENLAEKLLRFSEYESQAHAILAGIIAMRVALSPFKAPVLGPQSNYHLNDAMKANPQDPTPWVEKGNLRFHAPAIFGGSYEEAVVCYEKAVTLFDQQPELRANNWMYLHALNMLFKAYQKEGQKEKAIALQKKAVAYESRFLLGKNALLTETN